MDTYLRSTILVAALTPSHKVAYQCMPGHIYKLDADYVTVKIFPQIATII